MYVWSQENDSFPEISTSGYVTLVFRYEISWTVQLGPSEILKLGCSWTKSLSFLSFVIHNIKLYFLIISFFLTFWEWKIIYNLSGSIVLHQTVKKIVISCWWVKSSVGDQPNPSFHQKSISPNLIGFSSESQMSYFVILQGPSPLIIQFMMK